MNATDYAAIRERVDAITPGEWTTDYSPQQAGAAILKAIAWLIHGTEHETRDAEFIAFIAHAPADVRALLADGERLRANLRQAHALLMEASAGEMSYTDYDKIMTDIEVTLYGPKGYHEENTTP